MQKKRLARKPLLFLAFALTFWSKMIEKWNLAKTSIWDSSRWKKKFAEISTIPAPPGTPLSSNNLKKTVFFHVLGSPSAKIGLFWLKIPVRALLTSFSQKTYF